MANIKSAEKSAKKDLERRSANRSRMSTVRTYIKKLEEALTAKSIDDIKKAFIAVQSQLAKAASNGVIKKNKASRTTSRLNAKCKSIVLSSK